MRGFALLLTLTVFVLPADAQIRFRQNNTALPPFGGYTPGAGATLSFSTRGPTTLRQGSFDRALPQFGGFVPGSGARLEIPARAGNPAAMQAQTERMEQVQRARARASEEAARAQDARRSRLRERAAEVLFRKARKGESQNRTKLAVKYYRLAIARDVERISEQARLRLEELGLE